MSSGSVLNRRSNWTHSATALQSYAGEGGSFCFSPIDRALLAIPSLLLYPIFRSAHLPLSLDFLDIVSAYWVGMASRAVFTFLVFVVIAFPAQQTFLPVIRRYWAHKGLIVVATVLAILMIFVLGPGLGILVTVDALGIAELLGRFRGELKPRLTGLVLAAIYFFCGLILVFAYNHALAGIENPEGSDFLFHRLDRIAFHTDVSTLAHWSRGLFPGWWFSLLQFGYFTMDWRLAGTLVFVALCIGRQEAIRLVRTLLICYTMALFIYAIFPAKGPYASYPTHQLEFNPSETRSAQEGLTRTALALWSHDPDSVAGVGVHDYFISFPSLHIALPLIALWFLRPYRRLCAVYLLVYSTLLVPAVIFLEWHYLIDVLGGLAVAMLAVWLELVVMNSIHYPVDRSLKALLQ